MRANGSPPPKFETDEDRTSFLVRLPVHPQAKPIETPEVTGEVTPQVTPQVAQLLRVCSDESSRTELQWKLGLAARKNFRLVYLLPALGAGLIEMTVPAKPNSRLQKYRLTATGRAWLAAQSQSGGND